MGLIRLLLALAVVITHCQPHHYSALDMTAGVGSVQMFYIISGFYMALVLNRKYNWSGASRAFYLNRVLRLFPTYFAVVALTCAGGWFSIRCFASGFPPFDFWSSHHQHMARASAATLIGLQVTPIGQDAVEFLSLGNGGHLHFAKNLFTPVPAWRFLVVPQAWTLGVELLFYLVAPLIVRRRAGFIIAVASATLALRMWARHHLGLTADPWNYRFFPFELPLFLLGALAYKMYEAIPSRLDRPAISAALWTVVLLVIAFYQKIPDRPSLSGLPWSYFLFAGAMPWIFRLTRNWAWERWIGEISYPLYLCHMAVIFLFQAAGLTHHFIVVCCVASLALAIAIHLVVESPMEKLRQAVGKPAKVVRPVPDAAPKAEGLIAASQA